MKHTYNSTNRKKLAEERRQHLLEEAIDVLNSSNNPEVQTILDNAAIYLSEQMHISKRKAYYILQTLRREYNMSFTLNVRTRRSPIKEETRRKISESIKAGGKLKGNQHNKGKFWYLKKEETVIELDATARVYRKFSELIHV